MNDYYSNEGNQAVADVIVIGVGSMGSAACYYHARQGLNVLGLEQFDIAHEFGSHAGQSRIIRKAYFEHPDYVPLLYRAYANWQSLEEETGEKVFFKTGLLYAGAPDHEIIKGVKLSASLYDIELERPGVSGAEEKFPQFHFPARFELLFEPNAGFVCPEKAIRLYTERAIKYGAVIHTQEKVLSWTKDEKGISVTTDKNRYNGKKLVITAGAWVGKLVPSLANTITVTRQFVAWIKTKKENDFFLHHFPCWMLADENLPGCFYGFPRLPVDIFGTPEGLKLAHHHAITVTDPDKVNRETSEEDMETLMFCLEKYFPGTFDGLLHSKVCLYSNTPDQNFIIDFLPGYDQNVVVAGGFSGHGFKFVSVIGEMLTELITHGKTGLPIDFLKINRFRQMRG